MKKNIISKKQAGVGKRACSVVISLMMALGTLSVMPSDKVIAADENAGRSGETMYNTIMKSSADMDAPDMYNKNINPYGYGVDVPFFLFLTLYLLVLPIMM